MKEPSDFFKHMVDELILYDSLQDQELTETFSWIEEEAIKRGITTYQFFYMILQKYDADIKAKEWMENDCNVSKMQ